MRPYLRAANVTWSGLDLRDVKEMNFTEEESAVYELRPGDVVVAEASGSAEEVGKPAVWRGEIDGCCFQNTLIRVRTLGPLPEFLRYFLLGEAQAGRIGRASPGVGIHHIGATRLGAWRVPVPPLAEQRRIVAAIEEHLSRLDEAEETLKRAAARVRLLRQRVVNRLAEHGVLVRLEDCLAEPLVNGRSVPTMPDGFPVLRLSALRDGFIDLNERKLGAWSSEAAAPFLVREGDFFVARGNGSLRLVGRGGLVQTEPDHIAFPDTLIRVRVERDRVIPHYLRLVWDSKAVRDQIERTARTTAGIYKINQQDLRSIEFRLPNVAEQESLAAEASRELSATDALAAATANALLRGRALRRSILAHALRGELVAQDPNDEPASVLLEQIAATRVAAPKGARKRQARTPA